jgi:hypothetical protein
MKVRGSRRHVWYVRAFFVLVALPLLGLCPYMAVINNPNENVRTYMTIALVEEHTFSIDDVVRRFGWVNDMARVPGDGKKTDHYYSVKAPAVSYAGVPVYWLFRKAAIRLGHAPPSDTWTVEDRNWWLRSTTWALRLFVVQLPCFVFLVWFERYLRRVTDDVALRLSAVAAAGLGTNYLAYALMFTSHALFAISAFSSFAITARELEKPRARRSAWSALWAGFFCGLSTLLEYHALPVSVILAVWGLFAFYRPTRLAAFALGGAVNALAMMFFQWRAYGTPLTPGHKMVESAAFAAEHHQGIFGILLPSWEPFWRLSVDPGFGFFGMSPFMWLGLLAIPFTLVTTFGPRRVQFVRRWSTFVWLLAMLATWLVMSGALQWRGGWTIGPRYLGAAPPFFAFGAVCALEKLARAGAWPRAILRGLASGLAVASVLAIGFVGIVYNTLPPNITRPFAQFALPLARAGFVSHHAMEWLGWSSTTFWYVAATALVAAPLVGMLARGRLPRAAYAAQIGVCLVALFFGLEPQFSVPSPEEGPAAIDLRWFTEFWEPRGRDRITSLRQEAERYGPRRPCLWFRLSDLEQATTLNVEAEKDAKRAGAARDKCPPQRFAF